MGLPGPHAGSRIHPADRARSLYRRLHDQLGVNVFPGILGRTCDRPCEPACRRGRVEDETLTGKRKEPVAICRLKRVAADYKGDVPAACPRRRRRTAARGLRRRRAGLADRGARSGGARLRGHAVRPQPEGGRADPHPDPALPPARTVIDEEVGYITGIGNIASRTAGSTA
jgi:formate dehydrogenase (NADP+) beta subunit